MNIFEYPFVFRELNKYLTNKDKLKFISLNKFLNSKRKLFLFDKIIKYKDNLENEWYYDSILRLEIFKIVKLPLRLKILMINFKNINKEDALIFSNMIPRTVKRIILNQIDENCYFISPSFPVGIHVDRLNKNIILNNVKRLELSFLENYPLNSELECFRNLKHLSIHFIENFLTKIPNSVQSLNLRDFETLSLGVIPNSVKNLKLQTWKRVNLRGVIPNSVTKLKLYCENKKDLEECIPNSVTHLDIITNSNFIVPPNVTHLTYRDLDFLETIKMTSVINLTLIPYFSTTKLLVNIPVCVVHLTIVGSNWKFKFNLNNVKFLKLTKEYYEYIKDCIEKDIKISFIK